MFGIGFFEIIFILMLLLVVVVAFVAVLRTFGGGRSAGREYRDAQEILDERYAQGEIGREDYRRMRQDIEG